MPKETGVSAPKTVWSQQGIKGSVGGTVVTSLDQNTGVSGAYVALVDPVNPNIEYANTTSDAAGNFMFTGVNATYSSALVKGPDGSSASYQLGTNEYMIYVNKSGIGEGYSSAFGIDTNYSSTTIGNVVIYAGTNTVASPSPTAAPSPTLAPTASPPPATPTPAPPTATPAPAGQNSLVTLSVTAAIVILVVAAIAVYFLYLRKK